MYSTSGTEWYVSNVIAHVLRVVFVTEGMRKIVMPSAIKPCSYTYFPAAGT